MTKYYNVNNSPATGAEAFYNLGKVLSSSAWTIISSSDGSSYGAGETYFTSTSLAATNAWYIVQEPTGPGGREWCFQRTSANTTWRIKVSPNTGFSGGSPSATEVPSATDEGVIWGGGTDASPTGVAFFFTDGTYKFHIVAESTPVGPVGNEVYGWWAFVNTNGAMADGYAYALLCQEPLATGSYPALVGTRTSTTSGDADPCIYGANSVAYYGTYYNYIFNTAFFLNGYSSGNENVWNNFKYFYDYQSGTGTLTYAQEIMVGSANGTDYGVRGLGTAPDGKEICLPYHAGRQGTGANSTYFNIKSTELGLKGRMHFLRLRGTLRSNGVTTANLSDPASTTYIYVGDLLIPWPDGVKPLFLNKDKTMADYTGFILGTDNIVGLQTISQSLALFPPSGSILLAEPYSPNAIFPVVNTLPQPIFRGKIGGNYVYKVGSPPIGATDVVIIGYQQE